MQPGNHYINGVGVISPQRTFDNSEFLPSIATYDKNVLMSVTPDFKEYLTPVQLRRLGRMLRIGMSAAMICIRDSRRTTMEGIITATGYGFLNDTAVFLNEVLDQNEQHIAPTHFMQSTYNALSGMVALAIQCKGYNSTYVSRGFAFENALHDAFMQLYENKTQSFLVGSYDEADDTQYRTHLRSGYIKKEFISSNKLFDTSTPGTIQGEGAAFFCLSGERSPATWCSLVDVVTVYKPDIDQLAEAVENMLAAHDVSVNEIDLVINGASGDHDRDGLLDTVLSRKFVKTPQIFFKNLCGEYCTASSFALWLGASILRKQTIPGGITVKGQPERKEIILIANQYMGNNYSFMLLRKAASAD